MSKKNGVVSYADEFHKVRLALGLTAREAAAHCGIEKSDVFNIETGAVICTCKGKPVFEHLQRLKEYKPNGVPSGLAALRFRVEEVREVLDAATASGVLSGEVTDEETLIIACTYVARKQVKRNGNAS